MAKSPMSTREPAVAWSVEATAGGLARLRNVIVSPVLVSSPLVMGISDVPGSGRRLAIVGRLKSVDYPSCWGWPSGHARGRQDCYWGELALLPWPAVVDWPAGGAALPLLPLLLPPMLPLWPPLRNE